MMLLVKLNSLTDAELCEQYPDIKHLKRDDKIKFILSVED